MIVNGQQQQHIAIADRALQYGDGCFTTMAFRNRNIEFYDAHILRLKLACKILYIDFDKWSELACCIFDLLETAENCVVKVIITRGEGGRGYSPEGAVNPNFIITLHPIPPHYPVWQSKGIKLTISPIMLAYQPLLAGIKHLNRLEQVLVKQALAQTNYDDAVVCDTSQNIIETSVGNLFWNTNNTWFTPELTGSGVEGVMRNQVLTFMRRKGVEYQVVKHDINVLFSAQELFVCNSLMQLVPVVSLFNPINHQRKQFVTEQTKKLQRNVQHIMRLEAKKI